MLSVCLFMTGCFGVLVSQPVECDFDYPLSDYTYTKKEVGRCEGAEVIYFNKDDFLKWWGKPDEVINKPDNKEVWIYNKSDHDCGVVPAVGIPIPIVAPVCEVFDEITFEDDLAVHVHFKRVIDAGFVLGFGYRGPIECPVERQKGDKENAKAMPSID